MAAYRSILSQLPSNRITVRTKIYFFWPESWSKKLGLTTNGSGPYHSDFAPTAHLFDEVDSIIYRWKHPSPKHCKPNVNYTSQTSDSSVTLLLAYLLLTYICLEKTTQFAKLSCWTFLWLLSKPPFSAILYFIQYLCFLTTSICGQFRNYSFPEILPSMSLKPKNYYFSQVRYFSPSNT